MVEEQVPLFVCAVGIPPLWVVEKLHANGALVMNMAGGEPLTVCSRLCRHSDTEHRTVCSRLRG